VTLRKFNVGDLVSLNPEFWGEEYPKNTLFLVLNNNNYNGEQISSSMRLIVLKPALSFKEKQIIFGPHKYFIRLK